MRLIDQFIMERRYLKNVSPKTVEWYENSFRAFEGALDSKASIIARIAELRQHNVSAISVNTYLRCINAFLHWRDGQGEKCSPQCTHIRIPRLKEEQKVLATLSAQQIKRIIQFKPKGSNLSRAHVLCLLLLDTGLRCGEALALHWDKIDFENLVITVAGKGGKHRVVPCSLECRKILFRWKQKHTVDLVFPTRNGTQLITRNLQRDMKLLAQQTAIAGVRFSPHTLRHTFAVNYLRAGGNVLYLQRILGHSSLEMTNRYVRSLGIDDLKEVHNALSLLSR